MKLYQPFDGKVYFKIRKKCDYTAWLVFCYESPRVNLNSLSSLRSSVFYSKVIRLTGSFDTNYLSTYGTQVPNLLEFYSTQTPSHLVVFNPNSGRAEPSLLHFANAKCSTKGSCL
ncbi:MAG: hypothetical protein ACKPKO_06185 [Candidatus Fonsibacter sp.]